MAEWTYLAMPTLPGDTLIQLMAPLGVGVGDYLWLGNTGEELAKVTEVDDSGLMVHVIRGIQGRVRALPLLDFVVAEHG